MVLGAVKYSNSGHLSQAIRCNRLSSILYRGRRWTHIENILNNNLSKLYEDRSRMSQNPQDMQMAIAYTRRFMQMCNQPMSSKEFLEKFVGQLVTYLQQSGHAAIKGFNIPLIDTRSQSLGTRP